MKTSQPFSRATNATDRSVTRGRMDVGVEISDDVVSFLSFRDETRRDYVRMSK